MGGLKKSSKSLTSKKGLPKKTTLRKNLAIKKTPKKHTVAWYKKEARKYFNRAVKYRDSELVEGQWLFNCITCNQRILYKDRDGHTNRNAQAGHFMPEAKNNTRYHIMNVNGQCGMPCNGPNFGEQLKYSRALDLKYGDGTAAMLEEQSRIPKQWTIPELEEIIRESKEQIAFYENQA